MIDPRMGPLHIGTIQAAIRDRVQPSVCEMGMGGSTRFWLKALLMGGTLYAFENERPWADKVIAETGKDHMIFHDCKGLSPLEYALRPLKAGCSRFDVMLIDQAPYESRVESVLAAEQMLAPGGVGFLHDSEVPELVEAVKYIQGHQGWDVFYDEPDCWYKNKNARLLGWKKHR